MNTGSEPGKGARLRLWKSKPPVRPEVLTYESALRNTSWHLIIACLQINLQNTFYKELLAAGDFDAAYLGTVVERFKIFTGAMGNPHGDRELSIFFGDFFTSIVS